MAGQLPPFASIGVVCTLLYVIGFNVLRVPLGAGAANVVALTATMVLNTAANRRFTFGHRGRQARARHYVEAGAVWLVGLVGCVGAAVLVAVLVDQPGALVQTAALWRQVPSPPSCFVASGRGSSTRAPPLDDDGHPPEHRPTPARQVAPLRLRRRSRPAQGGGRIARARRGSGLGATLTRRVAPGDRHSLPLGSRRLRLGQRVLLGRRAGRVVELEGLLLRFLRRRQRW
jgi:putative flippase GtrA